MIIFNIREHPKTPFRLAKPKILFSEGNFNWYGGRMEDKNDAITDGAQKVCANGNKNMYVHHRGVINNSVESMVNLKRNTIMKRTTYL